MAKVIMKQFWGLGIECIVEALDPIGGGSSGASNFGAAHHTISVFFGAMWNKIVAVHFSEDGPAMETSSGVAAGLASEAPTAATAPVADPAESAAREKTLHHRPLPLKCDPRAPPPNRLCGMATGSYLHSVSTRHHPLPPHILRVLRG